MSHALLSELKEADATGRIADIYADLRTSLNVPMVNLIFRHLATVPGCLEWTWDQIGPLYVSGTFTRVAANITGQQHKFALQHGPALTLTRETLQHCGLDADAIAAIRTTCAAYARANPANLMGLQALKMILQGLAQDPPLTLHAAAPARPEAPANTAALTPLLPMGDLQSLPADTRAVLHALAIQVHGEDGPVIPSFYRHFTTWPAFLHLLHERLAALMPAVNAAVQNFEHASQAEVQTLLHREAAGAVVRPSPRAIETLGSVIARFPQNLCKMTLIPLALKAALEPAL